MFRWPALAIFPIVLAACATAPPPEKVSNLWDGYSSVAISPNGKLAAAANSMVVVLFDIQQQRQVGWFWALDEKGKSFRLPRTGIGDTLEFIDNERIVSTGMGGLATVWDIRNGELLGRIESSAGGMEVISLDYSETNNLLAMGTRDGAVLLADISDLDQVELKLIHAHPERVNDLVFSKDGSYLATAGHDKNVVIWEVENRQEIARHVSTGDISDLELVPARRSLIVAGDDIAMWQFMTAEEALTLDEDSAVGQWVGTGALYALQVGLLAVGVGGGLAAHDPQNCGRFVTVSPDGGFLVDVKPGPMSNKVTVLDVEQNLIVKQVDVPNSICDLEFNQDGSRLFLAGDGGAFLVETESWTILPMKLIVDGFSHVPRVGVTGDLKGLAVTGQVVDAGKDPLY